MAFKLNPLTGQLDLVGTSPSFDPDTILTGPTQSLYSGSVAPLEVLIDNNGNVLTAP